MAYRLKVTGLDRARDAQSVMAKFGLVRHYSWRTALCSRNCVDRFRARRQSDRN